MRTRRIATAVAALAALAMFSQVARANNIAVTNVGLLAGGRGYAMVQCKVSWDHSWRETWLEGANFVTNWDAAWVFLKFRYGAGGTWNHGSLSMNESDHAAPAGSAIKVGLTESTGVGVFLYRSELGHGSWTNTIALRWNYAQDGVADTSIVDVAVHAIEMVYVPEGAFALGSGGSEDGHFYKYPTQTDVFMVTNEDAIAVGTTNGYLYHLTGGAYWGDGAGPIPAAFPKGYAAFYCMKYEITQGQYADFLNQLTSAQASTCAYTGGGNRHTITGSHPNYSASAPDRACNNMSWADGSAYADWAGLRPMTELEFEKACRGLATAVPNEYAWGSTIITQQTGHVGTDGSGTETASPATANCLYNNGALQGPVRCGIYAMAASTRQAAGASYWGIMELSGNLWERMVTIGNADGRTFTGLHGNGVLTGAGEADVSNWPSPSTASGAGWRRGSWGTGSGECYVSCRSHAANPWPGRDNKNGWRGVRAAP